MFKNLVNIFNAARSSKHGIDSYQFSELFNEKLDVHFEDYYLSHSELQQVQEVMRENLNFLEVKHCGRVALAQSWKLRGDKSTAQMFYNDAAKIKKRIKALSAVQAKLKHSLITVG